MKNDRPKIRIKPQRSDLILEISGWVVVVISWLLASYYFSKLPDNIPIHYNLKGEVTNWGNKINVFLLPLISSILFIFITFLNYRPHLFNYPVKINEYNAFKNYFIAVRMNRYIKLLTALIFLVIDFRTIQISLGKSGELGFWTVPIIAIIFIFPMIALVSYMLKQEK